MKIRTAAWAAALAVALAATSATTACVSAMPECKSRVFTRVATITNTKQFDKSHVVYEGIVGEYMFSVTQHKYLQPVSMGDKVLMSSYRMAFKNCTTGETFAVTDATYNNDTVFYSDWGTVTKRYTEGYNPTTKTSCNSDTNPCPFDQLQKLERFEREISHLLENQ